MNLNYYYIVIQEVPKACKQTLSPDKLSWHILHIKFLSRGKDLKLKSMNFNLMQDCCALYARIHKGYERR